MVKALWNGELLAESDRTIVVEGSQYFPPETANQEFLRNSDTHITCSWNWRASYYDLVVKGEVNKDAAWYYPKPKPAAEQITGYVAFWKDVKIVT